MLVRLRVPLRCPVYVCCPLGGRARFSKYYSPRTLTTVGYGDVVPVSPGGEGVPKAASSDADDSKYR